MAEKNETSEKNETRLNTLERELGVKENQFIDLSSPRCFQCQRGFFDFIQIAQKGPKKAYIEIVEGVGLMHPECATCICGYVEKQNYMTGKSTFYQRKDGSRRCENCISCDCGEPGCDWSMPRDPVKEPSRAYIQGPDYKVYKPEHFPCSCGAKWVGNCISLTRGLLVKSPEKILDEKSNLFVFPNMIAPSCVICEKHVHAFSSDAYFMCSTQRSDFDVIHRNCVSNCARCHNDTLRTNDSWIFHGKLTHKRCTECTICGKIGDGDAGWFTTKRDPTRTFMHAKCRIQVNKDYMQEKTNRAPVNAEELAINNIFVLSILPNRPICLIRSIRLIRLIKSIRLIKRLKTFWLKKSPVKFIRFTFYYR